MAQKFRIFEAGDKRDSFDLLGLEIEQTEEGYQLVSPRRVLATAALFGIDKKPLLKFHFENFNGFTWTVDVDHADASVMKGRWTNNDKEDPGSPDEADSWTASGTGTEAGDDEAYAASAK